jgi:hypothetical protein
MDEEQDSLEIKRDRRGYIESVTGIDEDGYRVKFDFKRDAKHQLEKIEMRDE